MAATNTISVVIIAEKSLVREGMRRILDDAFRVTDSCASSRQLLDGVGKEIAPQLVLFDNGGSDNLCASVEELHAAFPDAHIVVLADSFRFEQMLEAFRIGADGYIVKQIACESLIESLRLIALGEKVMPSALADQLLVHNGNGKAKPALDRADLSHVLSEREFATLKYLFKGCPNKVIAHQLDISEATVKVHVKAILRKLSVQNRTQAAIWAVTHGIDFAAFEDVAPALVAG